MKAKTALAKRMSACLFRRALASTLASTLAVTAGTLTFSSSARADEVSPSGKGIVGGALLGGEVVTITMSLVGVRNSWAYLGGGVGGAIAGGIGGYFVEQNSSDGRVPIYMLAGGLALIIPGVVLTLNATSYQGNENATEDKAPTNTPAADPGQAGGSAVIGAPASAPAPSTSTPAGATPAPASSTPAPSGGAGGAGTPPTQAPQSMIDVRPSQLRFGVPVPEVRNAFTTQERVKYGANQVSEVHLGVLNVTF